MPLHLRSRMAVVVVLVGALSIMGVGCSSNSSTESSSATALGGGPTLPPIDPSQQLPPNDVATLRRLYDPVLEPLGLHLTRATLVDVTGGSYEPDDNGTHLALYTEPLGESRTDAQYVDGLWTVSALLTPDVFTRWSGLQSYDLCQEPTNATDSSPEPFPITQITLRRAASDSIDWQHGSLADLLYASRTQDGFQLITSKSMRETDTFRAADTQARERAKTGPPEAGTVDPNSNARTN